MKNIVVYLTMAFVLFGLSNAANAQYQKLLDFNNTNGSNPGGSLTLSGSILYGMTSELNGNYGTGNFFSINIDGSGYNDILEFINTVEDTPFGSLTLSGSLLYGMTSGGGTNGFGNIFSINTYGNGCKDIFDFNLSNGSDPYGSLTLSGSVLYGMTSQGGANPGDGNVFSVHTDGSGYNDLLDLNVTNGSLPGGDLTISGNVLYGMTVAGGVNDSGRIFSIHTDGSEYKDLLDFNSTNGAYPQGSLTLSGSVLYGMTSGGGANGDGVIFSINTDGSGYKDLLNFNGPNGEGPHGSLTLSGSVLYGMTLTGGANNDGVMFLIHTDGSGYKDLVDFNGTNGERPFGSLTLSGDMLYGMTEYGGAYEYGVIFSYDLGGNLGVNELEIRNEKLKIEVYPNPVNQLGIINYELGIGSHVNISVYDITGRMVCEVSDGIGNKGDNKISFDASGLRSGVYFVKVIDGNSVRTAKFVKE